MRASLFPSSSAKGGSWPSFPSCFSASAPRLLIFRYTRMPMREITAVAANTIPAVSHSPAPKEPPTMVEEMTEGILGQTEAVRQLSRNLSDQVEEIREKLDRMRKML